MSDVLEALDWIIQPETEADQSVDLYALVGPDQFLKERSLAKLRQMAGDSARTELPAATAQLRDVRDTLAARVDGCLFAI